MNTRLVVIAHAPLAHALRECALHVFPDAEGAVLALDVLPDDAPEATLAAARARLAQSADAPTLLLCDVLGATPCNVAQRLAQGMAQAQLVVGVNLPMLLRALSYRAEPLDGVVARALAGGVQGMMQVRLDKETTPSFS